MSLGRSVLLGWAGTVVPLVVFAAGIGVGSLPFAHDWPTIFGILIAYGCPLVALTFAPIALILSVVWAVRRTLAR
jgi:hypothetical protein